jgi:DNA-binding HxlR family transcriptional regulator
MPNDTDLEALAQCALADALKRLERNGLVTRTVLPTAPIGVEYAITPLGHSLRAPFEALCAWALTHGDAIREANAAQDRAKGSAPG